MPRSQPTAPESHTQTSSTHECIFTADETGRQPENTTHLSIELGSFVLVGMARIGVGE